MPELASYKKKIYKKIFFFASLKSMKKSYPELDPDPEPDPDPLVRGTDPEIRIRTKMSRIPNTASQDVPCLRLSLSLRVLKKKLFSPSK